MVERLLEHGAAVTPPRSTAASPLFYAAQSGAHTVVQALLRRGAGVEEEGPRGWSPLLIAAAFGHTLVWPRPCRSRYTCPPRRRTLPRSLSSSCLHADSHSVALSLSL